MLDLVSRLRIWAKMRSKRDGHHITELDEWKAADRIEALESALRNFQAYGCPICHGDCGSANPPVLCCPMREAQVLLSSTTPKWEANNAEDQ